MNETNPSTKKEVPFIEILKRAGQIVWQNKFLVWFGFLMALGSPGSFNVSNNKEWNRENEVIRNFIETHWQLFLIVIFVLLTLSIFLFLLSLLGKAGLVQSISLIIQNRKTNFREGWKAGKKSLWNLFKLSLLFFFAIFIIVLVLSIPVIFLAVRGSWISATLVGLLAIAIFIPLAFILALTNIFAEFYIILSNLKVWPAIETGYNLLIQNIKNSFIFALLMLAVNMIMIVGIIFLFIFIITLLILVSTGIIFYGLGKIVFGIFLGLAIFLALAILFFISSVFLTYKTTAWTLFFYEIASIKTSETEKVSEEKPEKEIAAAAEKA
jgi:hypothetical protein